MGYTTAVKDAALDAIGADGDFISFHTADPGATGANEVVGGSYARVATTWGSAAGSVKAGSPVVINVPASTTVTHWGLWSLVSAGTFITGGPLPAPQTFSVAGTYTFTPNLTASG